MVGPLAQYELSEMQCGHGEGVASYLQSSAYHSTGLAARQAWIRPVSHARRLGARDSSESLGGVDVPKVLFVRSARSLFSPTMRKMLLNRSNCVQATPGCALLFVLAQVPGAPDAER
jgi:hypothetical protein